MPTRALACFAIWWGVMLSGRLRMGLIAVAVGIAAVLSVWAVAVMVRDIMQENSYPPIGLYFLWFALLAMFWSGLSLLRWKTNVATVVLLISSMFAIPFGLLVLLLRIGLSD